MHHAPNRAGICSFNWKGALRAATVLPFLLLFSAITAFAADSQLSSAVISQIQQLDTEKASRTPTQQKINSSLLLAIRVAAGNTAMYGDVPLQTAIAADADGLVAVDIRVPVDSSTLALVTSVGGKILGSYPFADSIQARVPLGMVEQLASDPRVMFIRPPSHPSTHRAIKLESDVSDVAQQPLSPRLQRFQTTVHQALATQAETQGCCGAGPILNSGIVNSQGDVAHRANNARAAFSVNGAGVVIGVLSDSFNNQGGAAADVTSGDLPGPGNPNGFVTAVGFAGSGDFVPDNINTFAQGDEGRAMLQIVHDLAPGAQLYFATAFNSDTDFANNIRALAGISPAPGTFGNKNANIIIDDVGYSSESGLHDGQNVASNGNIAGIAQAVNDVAAAGVLYFSSAANSGNKVFGTSGAWEGDFVAGTKPAIIPGTGSALVWSGTDVYNQLTSGAPYIDMQWSDPINGACNDYDLYLVNSSKTAVLLAANDVQSCLTDPLEELYNGSTLPSGAFLVVVLRTASVAPGSTSLPRFISLTTNRATLAYNTNGATRGHNAPLNGFSVAATPAQFSFGPPTPNGPYPGPFVASNTVENFSSDGPRRAFFNPNLSAITPGNFLAGTGGGAVHQKPDFTAADGTETTVPGFIPFYGTSAAAPHAGAIAALVKQAAPAATPAQIANFLRSTALDIMSAGFDDASGVGILQAYQAVSVAKGGVGTGNITVTRTPAPGPLMPGDSATMIVQIVNYGAAAVTGITAVLTTTTPCITINAGASAYPNIAAGANSVNAAPFAFSLSPSCVCPVIIDFKLTVTFAGGSSTVNFSYVTGPPPTVINGNFISTPALPAGYTFAAGTQNNRLSRNRVAGSCAAPKAYPGLFGVGSRRYDSYKFTTGSISPSYCVSVQLDNLNPGNPTTLQTAGYVGTFDPLNIATNYASDAGNSGATTNYSFTVAANTVVTITVNEVATGGSGSAPYTLTIGGLCGVAGGATAPTLTSASSRKVHGTAGTFDLVLGSNPLNPSTETRSGPNHTLVYTFNKPVTAGTAAVSEGVATVGGITFSGNEMRVPLSGVTDAQYVTVGVSSVVAADGGTGGTGSARLGFLFGDANQSRQVTVGDVGIVNASLLQVLTNINYLFDVNVDGKLTVADKGLVNAALLKKLPAP